MSKCIKLRLEEDAFVLEGETSEVSSNRRLRLSLNRLGAKIEDSEIVIPLCPRPEVELLEDIQSVFKKFDYEFIFDGTVDAALSSFRQEQQSFSKFSEKALQIREGNFDGNPELVENFRSFKDVLEQTLVRRLYPLQMLSAFHMAFSQHSCNFAVPGAGKTSIVYGAYSYLKHLPEDDQKKVDKIMVIGPLSSFAPWENEYRECFGVDVLSQRLSGDLGISRDKKEQHLYSDNPSELTLISHASISLFEEQISDFLSRNKTMLVVDEAHKIKNVNGISGISAVNISKNAKSRLILTGTPVPNGYEDLFNLYKFIYPFKHKEILQVHYEQLREMTRNQLSLDNERVERFVSNIKPYFIRIKKSDLGLPPSRENVVGVKMCQQQTEIYNFIESRYVASFRENPSGTAKDILNKAKLMRLRQAATNPSLLLKPLQDSLEDSEYGSDPNIDFAMLDNESITDKGIFSKIVDYRDNNIPNKFIEIKKLIDSVSISKGKIIVWTIFIQNAEELKKFLDSQGVSSRLLIGRVPLEERENIVERFNDPDDGQFNVVIANPFSVSESISLHMGCHNAVYMERDYNAANFLQSKDRIHRKGLPAGTETNYFYLITENTIDTVINEKINHKVERMEKIIDNEIPLFAKIDDADETDVIKALLSDYANKSS